MKTKILLTAFVTSFISQHSVSAQGSLTPPGAPAPMMKTLDQIEPRTPVDATHAPGNFLAQFIISQPGSYYLTNNIMGVSGKRGIEIDVGNVTLDLNGFSLVGAPGSLHGIYFAYTTNNYVVARNGVITGWGGSGVYHLGQNGVFDQLVLATNVTGITCGDGDQVRGCTVSGNLQVGVYVIGSGNLILNNNCAGNNIQNSGTAAGIYVVGNRNRIEGNHVTGSGAGGYGIYAVGTTNVVFQNSVLGGGANNYSYSAGNIIGPLINTTTASIITNSNPWANFSF